MELTEEFRLQSKTEVANYLKSRGFTLFSTLRPRLEDLLRNAKILSASSSDEESAWKKTQLDENWVVRVKETRDEANDYCQYEIYSEIDGPTEEQI